MTFRGKNRTVLLVKTTDSDSASLEQGLGFHAKLSGGDADDAGPRFEE